MLYITHLGTRKSIEDGEVCLKRVRCTNCDGWDVDEAVPVVKKKALQVVMFVPRYPPPVVGGLPKQAHELARTLVSHGHGVKILTRRFAECQNQTENRDGVQIRRIEGRRRGWLASIGYYCELIRELWRSRFDADLLHVHNISWVGGFVTLAGKWLGFRVVTKIPNVGRRGVGGVRKRVGKQLRVRLLKMSDVVAALAPESIEELERIDYPAGRILPVANGIAIERSDKRLGQKSKHESLIAVFVGRLIRQKGLHDLLAAWREVVRTTERRIELKIIGSGPEEKWIKRHLESMKTKHHVILCGYTPNVPAKLEEADIFVLPSYREGQSNAILEAMVAGLPIVATDVGGTRFQVGSKGQDYLIRPGDRRGLKEVLVRLINNDQERVVVGKYMRRRVRQRFEIGRIARVYERAYRLMMYGRADQARSLAMW